MTADNSRYSKINRPATAISHLSKILQLAYFCPKSHFFNYSNAINSHFFKICLFYIILS